MSNETLGLYQRQAGVAFAKHQELKARLDAERVSLNQQIAELTEMFNLEHEKLIADEAQSETDYKKAIERAKTLLFETYQDGDPKTNGALQVAVSKGKIVINDMPKAVEFCAVALPQAIDSKVNTSKLLKAVQADLLVIPDGVDYMAIEYPVTVKVLTKKFAELGNE